MVHIHHSQPLKIKFGTNHFLGSATLGPKQYRKGVKERSMNSEFFYVFVCDESYIEVASSHADYNFFFQFYSHHCMYD